MFGFCCILLFTCVLALIIALSIISPFELPFTNTPYADSPFQDMIDPDSGFRFVLDKNVQAQQTQLFASLLQILNDSKIEYWLTEETLLFAYRSKMITACQDRVSIAVQLENKPFLDALKRKLPTRDFVLYQHEKGGSYRFAVNEKIRFPFVEIDIVTNVDNELLLCTPFEGKDVSTFHDSIARRSVVYPTHMVFPTTITQISLLKEDGHFESIAVKIPRDPDACLKRSFGARWSEWNKQEPWWRFLINQKSKSFKFGHFFS